MNLHQLSFAKIIIIRNDLAEVISNEGIELTVDMLKELYHFLDMNLELPCSLLINKVNSYNYSFDALEYFGVYKEIKATAIVVYNQVAEAVSKYSADFTRDQAWNTTIFKSRESALEWLLEQ